MHDDEIDWQLHDMAPYDPGSGPAAGGCMNGACGLKR